MQFTFMAVCMLQLGGMLSFVQLDITSDCQIYQLAQLAQKTVMRDVNCPCYEDFDSQQHIVILP